jgi:hypothetical protein
MLVYATRTFSNTLELILSSALLYLVAYTIKRSDETVHLQAGLAIKNPHKKTHRKKILQTFSLKLIFYEQIRHKLSLIYKKIVRCALN